MILALAFPRKRDSPDFPRRKQRFSARFASTALRRIKRYVLDKLNAFKNGEFIEIVSDVTVILIKRKSFRVAVFTTGKQAKIILQTLPKANR